MSDESTHLQVIVIFSAYYLLTSAGLFKSKFFALRSQSVRVDQHPAVALLFQPPVCEVLREPTRGAFRRKILNAGAIDDGDAELRLDRIQGAADSILSYVSVALKPVPDKSCRTKGLGIC